MISLLAHLWAILFANRKVRNLSLKNILLVFPYGIGNTVLANGALRSIKKRYPDSELTAIYMQQPTREILEILGGFKDLIYYDVSERNKDDSRHIKELSDKKFDVAINFFAQGSYRFNRVLMYAKVPIRIGFQLPEEFGGFKSVLYLSHYVKYDSGISEFKNDLNLLNVLNIPLENTISFSLNKYKHAGGNNVKRVGIHVGKKNPLKPGWPVEKFADVVMLLKKRYDADIFIFGGKEEKDVSDCFEDKAGNIIVNLIGKEKLESTIDYIHSMDVFITNDTGLMHIAAAQDIPVIAIFGPTDKIKNSPIMKDNRKFKLISKNLDCQPCYPNLFAIKCKGRLDCVNSISVEDVIGAISPMVKNEKYS
ncbi:MAG: glycosyltransferase family 9 protein [Candidatus Omnitrophota bacterium]|jgi:heptosyltransferase-2